MPTDGPTGINLLFILLVIDMPDVVKHSTINSYADDITETNPTCHWRFAG